MTDDLNTKINTLEVQRINAVRRIRKRNIIFFSIIIPLYLILYIVYKELFMGMIMFLLIATLFIYALVVGLGNEKITKEYKNNFMQQLLPIAVQSILTDIYVDANKGISSYTISSTHSMSTGDHYYSNNYVRGKYKNINVEMSDVKIEEEYEDSDGDTHTSVIFKGQWMIFDFNKPFKSNVQVWEKKILNGIHRNLYPGYHKIELEDIEFNKKFQVLAVNDLDSFYIITPHMMEKITEVEKQIHGTLLLVFLQNKLHVGVYNNKETFKFSIYKKINYNEFAARSIEDLSAVVKFVEILDLDNELFKSDIEEKVKNMKINTNVVQNISQGVGAANTTQEQVASIPQVNKVISDVPNMDAVSYLNDASDGVIDNK